MFLRRHVQIAMDHLNKSWSPPKGTPEHTLYISLKVYQSRNELDGTLDTAIKCLKLAQYQIEPYEYSIIKQILDVDYPGHTLTSAEEEARNRQQNAYESILHLEEEIRHIRYDLDHAESEFAKAQHDVKLFNEELEKGD